MSTFASQVSRENLDALALDLSCMSEGKRVKEAIEQLARLTSFAAGGTILSLGLTVKIWNAGPMKNPQPNNLFKWRWKDERVPLTKPFTNE